jgi:VanZ family protein
MNIPGTLLSRPVMQWLLAVSLLVVLVGSVIQPGGMLPGWLRHGLAYAWLGFLAVGSLPQGVKPLLAVSGVILFGVLIEVIQYFLPWRTFDVDDIAANIVGAFLGWALAAVARRTFAPRL